MRDVTAHSRGKVYIPPCLIRRILFDKIELNKGLVVENVVAQMLTATGRDLYFFSRYDKSNAKERMEIDFLIAKSKIGSRKECISD